jgi:glyoxylase-like metal-dependent hydrolase (beta-lactamase superfamily II)
VDLINVMSAEKITSTIYKIWDGECLTYAVTIGQKKICLIDAGVNSLDDTLDNINSSPLKGRTIAYLILTHCHYDHIGAAYQFKEKFPEIQICAHSWDKEAIEGNPNSLAMTAASWYGAKLHPIKLDYIFKKDREVVNWEGTRLTILHIPGHTPGSIAVFMESEGKKVIFAQDVHGPFMPEFKSNIEDWASSMKKILALESDILCEGHYGIYPDKERVKKYIESQLKQNGF